MLWDGKRSGVVVKAYQLIIEQIKTGDDPGFGSSPV